MSLDFPIYGNTITQSSISSYRGLALSPEQGVGKLFEKICHNALSIMSNINNMHTTFYFDICLSYIKEDEQVIKPFFLVDKSEFEVLQNFNDFGFVKKTFEINHHGIFEIQDVFKSQYNNQHMGFMIIGQWKFNTVSYLTDFLETVMEDCIEDISHTKLVKKEISSFAATNSEATGKSCNVWKNTNNLSQLRKTHNKKVDNEENAIQTNVLEYSLLVYDEHCFQPPVYDMNLYGINSFVFHKFKNTSFVTLLRDILSSICVMERQFVVQNILLEEHKYGVSLNFCVGVLYVGEILEVKKREEATLSFIIKNVFDDFINTPITPINDYDEERESYNDLSDELELNNLSEEKTENYLIEHQEIF